MIIINYFQTIFDKVRNFFNRNEQVKTDSRTLRLDYLVKNGVNLTYTASVKFANMTTYDSHIELIGTTQNERIDTIQERLDYIWRDIRTFTTQVLGTGEKIILPYVADNSKIMFSIVPKTQYKIIKDDGEQITEIWIISKEKYIKTSNANGKTYQEIRRMAIENNTHVTEFIYSDGQTITIEPPAITEWVKPDAVVIGNCDRLLLGRFVCPVDPRTGNKWDSTNITSGLDHLIAEYTAIKEQIKKEYEMKKYKLGVGIGVLAKDKKGNLQINHNVDEYVLLNADDFSKQMQEFNPEIRYEPLQAQLNSIAEQMERAVGFSKGIFSNQENLSSYTNQADILRALFDNVVMVDSIRKKTLETGMQDLTYAITTLLEFYNPRNVNFKDLEMRISWSNAIIETPTEEYNQLLEGLAQGFVGKEEVRAWLMNEDIVTAKNNIDEISKNMADISGDFIA